MSERTSRTAPLEPLLSLGILIIVVGLIASANEGAWRRSVNERAAVDTLQRIAAGSDPEPSDGYVFETTHGPSTRPLASREDSLRTCFEAERFATASPVSPGVTGTRYFATNPAGVVFYRTDAPCPLPDHDEQPITK